MFGYVLPRRDRLSEEAQVRYHAAYCGLCRALKLEYGFAARFLVNYDMTFLYFLLREGVPACPGRCFCPARPWCRKACLPEDGAMRYAADLSVLLSWWKLLDARRDSRGPRRLAAKAALAGLDHHPGGGPPGQGGVLDGHIGPGGGGQHQCRQQSRHPGFAQGGAAAFGGLGRAVFQHFGVFHGSAHILSGETVAAWHTTAAGNISLFPCIQSTGLRGKSRFGGQPILNLAGAEGIPGTKNTRKEILPRV